MRSPPPEKGTSLAGNAPRALFRVEDVALLLGISRRQVFAMLAAGRIPVVRVGKRVVRFIPGEIDAWVRAGCPGVTEFRRAHPEN